MGAEYRGGGSKGISGLSNIAVLAQSAIPMLLPCSGIVRNNGVLELGNPALWAGSLSFASTAAGAGVVVTGTGTAFTADHVNCYIIVEGKACLITAFTNSTTVTVTILTTLSTSTFANGAWAIAGIAFQCVLTSGAWVYLPANAIQSGSAAGVYWSVWNANSFQATVYNNLLTTDPSPPAFPTPFVSTNSVGYTQTTGQLNLFSVTLPANVLGLNGAVRMEVSGFSSWSSSSASRLIMTRFAGQQVLLGNVSSSNVVYNITSIFRNKNSLTSQFVYRGNMSVPGIASASVSGSTQISVDTGVDQQLSLAVNHFNPLFTTIGIATWGFEVLPS